MGEIMATYVTSDIHGEYTKFLKLLSKIKLTKSDTLYILGDVIDRNPGGIQILEHIRCEENIILLKGNHEQLMVEYYKGMDDVQCWFNNGGYITHTILQEKGERYTLELLDYLESLPAKITIGKYILVHGGFYVPGEVCDKEEAFYNSNEEEMLWNREFFISNQRIEGYTVISGHTSTLSLGSNKIIHKEGKILVDCGCGFYKGKLACLRLEDCKEIYV